MNVHKLLDLEYGPDGDAELETLLERGADLDERAGEAAETALHVAVRRRRLSAVKLLLKHGASIEARTAGRKTAYVHAIRRGFGEVADYLRNQGASLSS